MTGRHHLERHGPATPVAEPVPLVAVKMVRQPERDDQHRCVVEEHAHQDVAELSAGGNPVPVDAAALERIFRAAVAGELAR